MTKVIALHGNPGTPADWNSLSQALGSEFDLIAVDSWSEQWIDEVLKGPERKIIVAHSWGCYRVLKNLKALAHKIEKVILLNPYLVSENPLSTAAATILNLPLIGNSLLKGSHRKSIHGFVEQMVSPHKISDRPDFQASLQRLEGDWTLWKKAAQAKVHQQGFPLTAADGSSVAGYFIWGNSDKSSHFEIQSGPLKWFPGLQIQRIENEGHSLLWSQIERIVALVKGSSQMDHRIGYFPGEETRNNVITYMEKHLAEHPDRIALRWANRQALAQWSGKPQDPIAHDQINFRDFAKRIHAVAAGLLSIGLQKGDRVIIFLPMSLDMYTAMFAAQRIGAIAVFLDSWARSHHLGASAECVGPKAMISFKQAFDLVDQVPEFRSMPIRVLYGPGENGTHKFETLLQAGPAPIAPVESETTALITFTTGSTGKPKGANRTHRFLSAQHAALNHVIPYTEKDADMPAFPIFSLNNLAAGVTTVLPAIDLATPSPRDPGLLVAQILNEKITCTTLSPSMLVGVAGYCQEQGLQLTGLRRVVTGGAPISKDDVKSFYAIAPQTDLWILYGSTEAEPMAHIEGRDMLASELAGDPEIVESGVNVGHISEDVEAKFIRVIQGSVDLRNADWKTVEVPAGQVGEFLVTGDHVCRDYYNNPDAFKSTKIEDRTGRVWHRTGDLAYIDAQKNLWIVGRVNNAIERKGTYYFPVQAEVLLKRMNFTHRCAFLGMPHRDYGQANWAVVELKPEFKRASFNQEEARAQIQRIFGKNNIPLDAIRFVDAIPMDPRHHSKVEYGVLRKQLETAD